MRARDVLLLAGVLLALLVALLVWPPIAQRGEAREGLVVRELVAGGDWVLPRRQGVIASKPPLYHWLAATAARTLGWSDAAVRLPSALAAWAMALETFALGMLVAGCGVAWLAVGILFATWGFWRSALEARVDMLFAACVVGSIVSFAWWALRAAPPGRLLCWLAAAAAVLTKGPIGFVLPALVVLAFLLSGRDRARLRALWSWTGAVAAFLVVGSWYVAATASGGRAFLAVQLMKENVDRFAGRGAFVPTQPLAWLLIPRYFLSHLAPWCLAIADDARRWWRGGRVASDAGRLLHCWWLVVLVVFTLAAGKRSVYLLPLYPPVAVLAARALRRAVASPRGRALTVAAVVATALVTLGASYRERIREAQYALLPLAHAVTTLVPPGAALGASKGMAENDVLVLAYLLDRPLMRARIACQGARAPSYYLRPVPSGAGAIPLERLAVSGTLELARCPTS